MSVQLSNVQEKKKPFIITKHCRLSVSCRETKTLTPRDLKNGDEL